MKQIAFLALMLIVAGCAAPTPISMSKDSVSIQYDAAYNSQDEVKAQAENYCETMNKKAVFRATTVQGIGWGLRYDQFECVRE